MASEKQQQSVIEAQKEAVETVRCQRCVKSRQSWRHRAAQLPTSGNYGSRKQYGSYFAADRIAA